MPNICTHLVFGARVAEAVRKPPDTLGELYLLGCLGPDYYFYDRLPPTPFVPHRKKHGNVLHETDCAALFTALEKHADASLRPYLYGFLTHIALDSTVHPYVDARHPGSAHSRFEGVIDSIVYAQTRDEFAYPSILKTSVNAGPVDALLSAVSKDLCGASVSGAYLRGVRKQRRLVPLMFDPKNRRYRFVRFVERLFKKPGVVSDLLIGPDHEDGDDCMNLSRRRWTSPWEPDHVRDESVPELFDEAKLLAVELIRAFDAGDSETLRRLLHNRTMKKGALS
ncbi:MAG: zinc dependent phospholipase C family protein [Clostridia bacterium]|nr:zinc dependent phospholipase C family protein [Clostridia bacterium]